VNAGAASLPRPRLRVARRLGRDASGFGLVELLIALMILNIGIFATLAAFNSGLLALRRANKIATASTLANKQMELYRALVYDNIGVLAPASPCDANYCGDSLYSGSITVASCASGNPPEACQPINTVTGPDGNPYRVDTYVHLRTETTGSFPGRTEKAIGIVVRDAQTLKTLMRTESTFDKATGS
jgi:type II secretory pathway pseudopilin PulG